VQSRVHRLQAHRPQVRQTIFHKPEDYAAFERVMLDRLTHGVHILEVNGESYRLRDPKRRLRARKG
jgi:mRNA-degrading endonuclease HigB of HigAB toxin-antitoxin module